MSKKKTKINTILAAIVTAGVLITIILLGLWGMLKNRNTNLLALKIAIIIFALFTTLVGVVGGIYSNISARTKGDTVAEDIRNKDKGEIGNEQEDE